MYVIRLYEVKSKNDLIICNALKVGIFLKLWIRQSLSVLTFETVKLLVIVKFKRLKFNEFCAFLLNDLKG